MPKKYETESDGYAQSFRQALSLLTQMEEELTALHRGKFRMREPDKFVLISLAQDVKGAASRCSAIIRDLKE